MRCSVSRVRSGGAAAEGAGGGNRPPPSDDSSVRFFDVSTRGEIGKVQELNNFKSFNSRMAIKY